MITVSAPSCSRDLGRGAVRQGEEDHVVAGQSLGGGRLDQPIGQRHQVRLGAHRGGGRRWRSPSPPRSPPPGARAAAATAPRPHIRWLRPPLLSIDTCMNMPLTARLCKLFRQWRSPEGPDRSRDSRRY